MDSMRGKKAVWMSMEEQSRGKQADKPTTGKLGQGKKTNLVPKGRPMRQLSGNFMRRGCEGETEKR